MAKRLREIITEANPKKTAEIKAHYHANRERSHRAWSDMFDQNGPGFKHPIAPGHKFTDKHLAKRHGQAERAAWKIALKENRLTRDYMETINKRAENDPEFAERLMEELSGPQRVRARRMIAKGVPPGIAFGVCNRDDKLGKVPHVAHPQKGEKVGGELHNPPKKKYAAKLKALRHGRPKSKREIPWEQPKRSPKKKRETKKAASNRMIKGMSGLVHEGFSKWFREGRKAKFTKTGLKQETLRSYVGKARKNMDRMVRKPNEGSAKKLTRRAHGISDARKQLTTSLHERIQEMLGAK